MTSNAFDTYKTYKKPYLNLFDGRNCLPILEKYPVLFEWNYRKLEMERMEMNCIGWFHTLMDEIFTGFISSLKGILYDRSN